MKTNRKTGALIMLAGAVLAAPALILRHTAAGLLARWDHYWVIQTTVHPFGAHPVTTAVGWAATLGVVVVIAGAALVVFPRAFAGRRA